MGRRLVVGWHHVHASMLVGRDIPGGFNRDRAQQVAREQFNAQRINLAVAGPVTPENPHGANPFARANTFPGRGELLIDAWFQNTTEIDELVTDRISAVALKAGAGNHGAGWSADGIAQAMEGWFPTAPAGSSFLSTLSGTGLGVCDSEYENYDPSLGTPRQPVNGLLSTPADGRPDPQDSAAQRATQALANAARTVGEAVKAPFNNVTDISTGVTILIGAVTAIALLTATGYAIRSVYKAK